MIKMEDFGIIQKRAVKYYLGRGQRLNHILSQLGPNHVCVILSGRRDTIRGGVGDGGGCDGPHVGGGGDAGGDSSGDGGGDSVGDGGGVGGGGNGSDSGDTASSDDRG